VVILWSCCLLAKFQISSVLINVSDILIFMCEDVQYGRETQRIVPETGLVFTNDFSFSFRSPKDIRNSRTSFLPAQSCVSRPRNPHPRSVTTQLPSKLKFVVNITRTIRLSVHAYLYPCIVTGFLDRFNYFYQKF
jgi:hypothetical protein